MIKAREIKPLDEFIEKINRHPLLKGIFGKEDIENLNIVNERITPKMPTDIKEDFILNSYIGFCPECGEFLENFVTHCPECGQVITWDGDENSC